MFSKLLCVALVGVATSQESPGVYTKAGNLHIRSSTSAIIQRFKVESVTYDEITDGKNANQAALGNANQLTSNVEKGDEVIEASIAAAKDAVPDLGALASAVDTLENDAADLTAAINAKLTESSATFRGEIVDAQAELAAEIDDKFNKLRAALSVNQDALGLMMKVQLVAAEAKTADLEVAADSVLEKIEAHEACMNAGQIYDEAEDECVEGKAEAKDLIGKVWYRHWTASDGRENGYLNERYVNVAKSVDETYLRVVYYDNFRVHGHTAHGNWNVMFCDKAGNGCAECREPGKINSNKYASHQGNWWMNDHIHGTILGICKKTDNKDLRKGEYRLRIMVNNARYDLHTEGPGHFMVDEVLKY